MHTLLSFAVIYAAAAAAPPPLPRPKIELLFSHDLRNSGSLGGRGRLLLFGPGESAGFGPGVRGPGLNLARITRAGGPGNTPAGAAVLLEAPALAGLEQFTLALWFKPKGPNPLARLLHYPPSWDVFLGRNSLNFKVRHNGRDFYYSTPPNQNLVQDGAWNFLAIACDAGRGQAECWYGRTDAAVRRAAHWSEIPAIDHAPAELEIGNLGKIRPFRGAIDSVRIYDRRLDPSQIRRLFALDRPRPVSLARRTRALPHRAPLFACSDVCFSSRSIHPKSVETFRAFGADRLMWSYAVRPDFIQACKAAGARTYQAAINSLPGHDNRNAQCLDIQGNPMVAPWMVGFNRKRPVYWGCNNRPQFFEITLDRALKALHNGADWIQFDDWRLIVSAAQWGGACFCSDCMRGFREYLKTHLRPEQAGKLGIQNLDAFDYRRFLRQHCGVRSRREYLEKRRTLPLASEFAAFQRASVRRFFQKLRRELDRRAGRTVPLSINSTFLQPGEPENFLVDIADFLEGECWHLDLDSLMLASKMGEALGKWQVLVPKPRNVQTMRAAIAATYAMGQLMLVPWDMYMGSDARGPRPRYYGKPAEYADLYHFIRAHSDLFDACLTPPVAGVLIDLDHCDPRAARRAGRRLLDAQVPFVFLPAGRSEYPCPLAPERLRTLEAILRSTPEPLPDPADRAALKAVADRVPVFDVNEAPDDFLDQISPFTLWAPPGVYLLARVRPTPGKPLLVCHLINFQDRTGAHRLRYISFLVKKSAFPGKKLAAARWYVPNRPDPVPLDTESLNAGVRIIVPRLDLWGIAALQFQ